MQPSSCSESEPEDVIVIVQKGTTEFVAALEPGLSQEKERGVSAVPTREESHLEAGGHAWNHFSIPAIYCNALQMLPVVCMCVESFLHEQSGVEDCGTLSYQQVRWTKHKPGWSFTFGLFPVAVVVLFF